MWTTLDILTSSQDNEWCVQELIII